jgi:hypothetical protein
VTRRPRAGIALAALLAGAAAAGLAPGRRPAPRRRCGGSTGRRSDDGHPSLRGRETGQHLPVYAGPRKAPRLEPSTERVTAGAATRGAPRGKGTPRRGGSKRCRARPRRSRSSGIQGALSSTSSNLARCRSGVWNPSVNQPCVAATSSRASSRRPCRCQRRARHIATRSSSDLARLWRAAASAVRSPSSAAAGVEPCRSRVSARSRSTSASHQHSSFARMISTARSSVANPSSACPEVHCASASRPRK